MKPGASDGVLRTGRAGLPTAIVGQPIGAVPTPALVIDADALDRNIARMARFAAERGLRLRPHAKTHKSAHLARRQIDAGAVGVCVQKVSEALALADPADADGVPDLYVTNEVIDPPKLDALAALARTHRIALAIDSRLGAERLADALARHGTRLDVFVEIDVGQGRCGVPPAEAGALARHTLDLGLPLAGLQAYHGGAQHLRSRTARQAAVAQAGEAVAVARAALAAAGADCPLVTGGGTGTFALDAASGIWGELQCGSYVFMDRDYADNDGAGEPVAFEHALFVRAQVISRAAAHAVIDAGHKSYALDSGPPRVWRRPLDWSNGGDEHGIVRVAAGAAAAEALPALGDIVWLVPGHCDPTVNLHDEYVVVRGGLDTGSVRARWPVHARGALR